MSTTSISIAMVAAGGVLLASLAPGASALAQRPGAAFVARATVTVENRSPVPQVVAGTNVPPFELPPYRQAQLAMRAAAPPAAAGSGIPVRFHYSVGLAPGPQCRGTIDLSVVARGTIAASDEATHCVAHSLGTGGASCTIAVSARDSACAGGLAFVAP